VSDQLNEWRNDQWSNMLESLDPEDQSLEDDQTGDEDPHSITPLATPGGLALSDSETAKALAESLEA
jgi:hypothetical protein